MSIIDDHNRGFSDGLSGSPPPLIAPIAEQQGYQLGEQLRRANRSGSGGYPPAVERALTIIGAILGLVGLVMLAPTGYALARQLGAGTLGVWVSGAVAGLAGVGLGMVIPRLVMALVMLSAIGLVFLGVLVALVAAVLGIKALIG